MACVLLNALVMPSLLRLLQIACGVARETEKEKVSEAEETLELPVSRSEPLGSSEPAESEVVAIRRRLEVAA
jgi:hypothetical protein